MLLFANTDSITSTPNSQNSSPRDEHLEFATNCESNENKTSHGNEVSMTTNENLMEDDDESTATLTTRHQKRRGRKPKYPDPTPGYRSSYSVNRSFTQTEVVLLRNILKESGEPPADLFATRVNDATMVFPVNEENPKNQELLSNARRKRSRNVTSPYQSRVLRKVLTVTSFPSTEMREALANELNMHPRTVQIWFQNQRQKAKNNIQIPTANTNTTGNASTVSTSASMNSRGGEMTSLDDYNPGLMSAPMSAPMSTTGISAMYFPNLTFQNNNVSHDATPYHYPDTHSQLTAQSFLPDATTYMNTTQFASPYILPIFPSTPLPSPPTPTYLHATFHHPQFFHQTSSTASTMKFPDYSPSTTNNTTYHNHSHQMNSQQQQLQSQEINHHHNIYNYSDSNVTNPTLDILAAAAATVQAGTSHSLHHQIRAINASTNERSVIGSSLSTPISGLQSW
ncbi:10887_t:CDS:2 [Ambispora gerdemannii]|uniref:10887_t:CDS:1 n=1 Tax=Ambispora gerdemannii TaxID=144530 RepID=A0A9N9FAS7_9GLOM|nr:10887_t:CDS:2 [Ambispora gerdemannii]